MAGPSLSWPGMGDCLGTPERTRTPEQEIGKPLLGKMLADLEIERDDF